MRTLPTLALSIAPLFLALGLAHADPSQDWVTVDDRDYPICVEEDCSDQPGQIGVWFDPDTGGAWLSLGGHSVRIEDANPAFNPNRFGAAHALCTTTDAYAREMGDDDCDGRIAEGESGWRVNLSSH